MGTKPPGGSSRNTVTKHYDDRMKPRFMPGFCFYMGTASQRMFRYLGKVKRIYAILIFAILMTNAAGFYVYYAVQLQQIRAEMREALKHLPDHALEVLTLSRAAYNAAKVEEHEVQVNGKMYDVARIVITRDSVTVYGLHDAKEDNLVALLEEIISKPLKDRRSMPASILDFISLMFVQPVNELYLGRESLGTVFTAYHFAVADVLIMCDSPPPRILPAVIFISVIHTVC